MNRLVLPMIGIALTGALAWQSRARLEGCTSRTAAATAEPAPKPRKVRAEGRVASRPGAEVVLATEVGGTIARLAATEGTAVRAGDVLVELVSDEPRAALAEARARIAETEADLRWCEAEVQRNERLAREDVSSQRGLEKARRDREVALAQRDLALASARRWEAVLGKHSVRSPIDGVVVARAAHPGETIAAGSPLLTVADLSRTRVEAEVDEFDVERVALGAEVAVSAEGSTRSWRGRVEEIPVAVTPRKTRPRDPGRPSDTRVLLVKVALPPGAGLKLGQRVEVEIGSLTEALPARVLPMTLTHGGP